jgi:hypothetical protein
MEVGEERMQIFANEITPLAQEVSRNRLNGAANGKINGNGDRVHLYIRESEVSADELVQLRETLLEYRGPSAVLLHLCAPGKGETVIELPDQVRVASTPELAPALPPLSSPRLRLPSLAAFFV